MSVDIVERLRLNEDDWLFGQTARDAKREITALREQVEKQAAALKLAREALQGIHPGNMTPMAEKNWMEAIAAIDSLTAASEITTLREQVKKLEALVVMRCDLDVPPQFSQGLQSHEFLEPVTAEHCQWFVAKIEKLTEECVVLRASSRSKLETIANLEWQVEKLTMERDTEIARNRPLQSLIKSTEETKSFLLKKSEENKEAVKQLDSERQANALLTEELAALAEQNAKMRKVLLRLACLGNGDQYGNSIGNCIAQEALSLPNLATPVLNRIRADGMREAINLYSPDDSAQDWIDKIGARADELEKTNG